uniref:Polycystin domain-containing protein n=1 Tax=Biomphalaria glabrata TaxID=6526 RepID=A0A2C9M658_BIOGL
MIRDFFLYTIFMIFILLLVYGHMDILARFHQIRFTKHHYLGIYDPLNVIHDASGMWSYLNDVLLTRLIPNERNNSLKESLYLFGTVRLRQTRVKPDSGACSDLPETIRMIYNTEICIHSMEDGQEENNSFVNSWKVVYEDYVEDLEDSPFVYKSAEQLRTASFSGQRATYSGGGFVANFSRDNIQEARITLDTIKQSKWLDQYTR